MEIFAGRRSAVTMVDVFQVEVYFWPCCGLQGLEDVDLKAKIPNTNGSDRLVYQ